jgi:hypothetical protein
MIEIVIAPATLVSVTIAEPPSVLLSVDSQQSPLVVTAATLGPQGAQGISGIAVSDTAPSSPSVNDLWLDVS